MNKLKVFINSLLLLVLTGIFYSCDSEEIKGNGEYGVVSFSLKTDTSFVATKATPENLREYTIQISQAGKVIKTYSYDDMPEKMELTPGEYTVKAYWGTLSAAAFESLYMEGSETFVINADKTTQVSLLCAPANAKVTVDYAPEVLKAYSNYSISMTTSQTKTPLVFDKDETRAGYFKVNGESETLKLNMSFFVGNKTYPFTQSTTIKPRDFVRFHIKMDPNSMPPSLLVTPGYYYVGATGGERDFTVYCNQPEWTVSYNADWMEVLEWDNYVTIHVYPNDTKKLRQATITFETTSGDKKTTSQVLVVQEASSNQDEIITVTPAHLLPKAEGENGLEVAVACRNTSWTVENTHTWIEVVKENDKLIFNIQPNDTPELRNGSVELKTVSEGKESTATVFVFQEAIDRSQPASPLSLDIYINDTFIKEEVLEYELEPAEGSEAPPSISALGFEPGKLLTLKENEAPVGIRMNIQATGRIQSCLWTNISQYEADLAQGNHPDLSAAGLQWDYNMKGKTLSTIYLDSFINKLPAGTYSYILTVTDETGKSTSTTLTIKITNGL